MPNFLSNWSKRHRVGTSRLVSILKPGVATDSAIRPAQARAAVADGGQWLARSFASPSGPRAYKLYVPAKRGTLPRGLVVMLHGCTQDPEDFAAGTRMNAIADHAGFLVVWPAQTTAANGMKCWNWFSTANQLRDHGEPALIAGITREVAAEFAVDSSRIVIAGLSAGAAMAVVLGATYPELYAGVGVHSGLAFGVARSTVSAMAAMRGEGKDTAAPLLDASMVRPIRTIVFHGDEDTTVAEQNGSKVVEQAVARAQASLGLLKKTVAARRAVNGREVTVTQYRDTKGMAIVEYWLVHGGKHAWYGGSREGSHADASGPDASAEMVRFLLAQ